MFEAADVVTGWCGCSLISSTAAGVALTSDAAEASAGAAGSDMLDRQTVKKEEAKSCQAFAHATNMSLSLE